MNLKLPLLFLLIKLLECHSSCDNEGSPSYTLLALTDFPLLQFPGSVPDSESDILKRQIEMADKLNSVHGQLSTILSSFVNLSPVNFLGDVWTIATSFFDSMDKVGTLRDRLLGHSIQKKIKDAITQQALVDLQASFDSLKIPMRKMLVDPIPLHLKLNEVTSARMACVKIISSFKNKEGVLWTQNLATTPYLLDFAMIFGAISKISVQLEPHHLKDYNAASKDLYQVIQEYKVDVIPKRINLIETGSTYPETCQHLHYRDCTITNFLVDGVATSHEGSTATACSKSTEIHNKFWLGSGSDITHDPISNFSACGWYQKCGADYKAIVFGQLTTAFDKAAKFVWSGEMKETKQPQQKIEYTANRYRCSSPCTNQDTLYNWCSISNERYGEHWDYCSTSHGLDYKNRTCDNPCSTYGYTYSWCTVNNKKSWGYCSARITLPQNNYSLTTSETQVELSHNGRLCPHPCTRENPNDYFTCAGPKGHKNLYYCSEFPGTDYMGRKCDNECDFHGQSYQWCKVDDWADWGYCSNKHTTQLFSFDKGQQVDVYGTKCTRHCQWNGSAFACMYNLNLSVTGMCSLYKGFTIDGQKCMDTCEQRGQRYTWCNTLGRSWGYCSQSKK